MLLMPSEFALVPTSPPLVGKFGGAYWAGAHGPVSPSCELGLFGDLQRSPNKMGEPPWAKLSAPVSIFADL